MKEATRREALRLYANDIQEMDAYSLAGLIPLQLLRDIAQELAETELARFEQEQAAE